MNIVHPHDVLLHFDDKKLRRQSRRRITLKNVVFRIVKEVRVQKSKPKLRDLIEHLRGKDKEENCLKLIQLYGSERDKARLLSKSDPKADLLNLYLNRL